MWRYKTLLHSDGRLLSISHKQILRIKFFRAKLFQEKRTGHKNKYQLKGKVVLFMPRGKGSRGIAPLILDLGTRRGWVSISRDTAPVPIKHETSCAQGRSERVEEKYFVVCGGNLTTFSPLSGSQARRCTDYTTPDVCRSNITLIWSTALSFAYFVCVPGLHSNSPRLSAWQPSARVSQNFWKSYLSRVTVATYYVSRQILALPVLWLQKNTDVASFEFAHSPDLWQQPRLANVTCAWSWRHGGISHDIVYMTALSDSIAL
jgi:hypothetical protein